jgi:oxalate decarboxylase/phosphoglucose isomerase-like protein (cupin superfamily)
LADHQMIGKIGRVTGRIGPGELGEVMVSVRGGTEHFHAYADENQTIATGTRIVVVDYFPPRTVVVTPM